MTDGLTGADIAMAARNARRLARRAGREVTEVDILAALPPSRPLTADELLMVAVHEAGHAVVAMELDVDNIEDVRIADRVVAKGIQSLGRTRFVMQPAIGRTAEYHLAKVAMLLGGVAAEEAVFGAFCDGAGATAGADLEIATELATMLECQLGMGSTLLHDPGDARSLRATNPLAWRRVDELVRTQFDRAKSIVEARRPAVDRLARALVARRQLTGEEARAVVFDEPPRNLQFGSASATT